VRKRNLFEELIQGVEEMRALREAMFIKGRNAVKDARTADMGTQELKVDALSADEYLNYDLRKN